MSRLGRRVPFLRWSFVRMMLGIKHLTTEWQVGDGREEALRAYVLENAPAGDLDAAIDAVDRFAYERSYLINVGDEKGRILDRAVQRSGARLVLELGTYCGYSALRTARTLGEGGRIVSLEFNPDNAAIARAILEHAGVGERVTVIDGTLGDGKTPDVLTSEHGLAPGSVDLVFIDHDKDAYVPDLQTILERRWLHAGSVVVADNIKLPGAPEYREFMAGHQGGDWTTVEHETHVEYQSMLKDLVLESEYRGA